MPDLEVTLELVNTRHGPGANLEERPLLQAAHDHLVDPRSALAYLRSRIPDLPHRAPTDDELDRLRAVRDLAAEALDPAGGSPDTNALAALVRMHAYRFDTDGHLVPLAGGWDRLGARVLAGLFQLRPERERLRVCANSACRWLFLDESRNHSRIWCDMSTCGSRAKMTRYRRRRSPGGTPSTVAGSENATGERPARD